MDRTTILVERLGKRFRLGTRRREYGNLRDRIAELASGPLRRLRSVASGQSISLSDDYLWALEDVSFAVNAGEVLGVIGRNGAGKTTLLKILSRITEPTVGRAEIRGRVGSLLEVGTGFHPDLTGRENIYLNGAIIGMRRAEVDRKFDEIVAFSEVGRFLETQVKQYSSGMYLRLAFAVAAHLEPEILLMDEVLAVGDASFQRKCLGKVDDISRSGRTVLFVSHNMEAILRLCSRTIWVDAGRIAADGPTNEVVAAYLKATSDALAASYRAEADGKEAIVRLLAADVVDDEGRQLSQMSVGQGFTVRMQWRHTAPVPGSYYFVRVSDEQGRYLFGVHHDVAEDGDPVRTVTCRVGQNVLAPGQYRLSIGCFRRPSTTLSVVEDCLGFDVASMSFDEQGSGYSHRSLFVPRVEWGTAPSALDGR